MTQPIIQKGTVFTVRCNPRQGLPADQSYKDTVFLCTAATEDFVQAVGLCDTLWVGTIKVFDRDSHTFSFAAPFWGHMLFDRCQKSE